MEIVYNPPALENRRLSALMFGDLFKLPKAQTVYMKIEQYSSQRSSDCFVCISVTNGYFYSFSSNVEVIKLDGKLTVWEV